MPDNLLLIPAVQLTGDHPALADFERGRDQVLMIEAPWETTFVWSHKARIVLFL